MTNNDKKLIECFSDGPSGLVFWSFRYFLGRMTIATTSFAGELARAWPLLDERTQALIRRELEEEFHRDDEARQRANEKGEKPTCLPLGWDCDREAWQKVRDAYSANVHGDVNKT